ncbi:MAG: DNA-3-methyladenine glycosylase 2 family protein [Oscillospiraceae bacterium]|jgi:N-glycosylase/DNA lyase|nr:DNA-3-methyladenine glycosylase 2 family protein [Oscillospiraceae bacterium]
MTNVRYDGQRTVVSGLSDFSPTKIFTCGQCFRWRPTGEEQYRGVVAGRLLSVGLAEDGALIEDLSDGADSARDFARWEEYFDFARDYGEIRRNISGQSEYFRAAAEFGAGIRILRQEPFEALISFIISQCNNIPRIMSIVENLSRLFGERRVSAGGEEYFAFPNADALARLSEVELAPLRSGYRAKYILSAARAVDSGALDLDALCRADSELSLRTLMSMQGIGLKVASCVNLFGLGHLDSFPIDTWMKKAIRENCGDGFDPRVFGAHAGIAQQYMFFYQREGAAAAHA